MIFYNILFTVSVLRSSRSSELRSFASPVTQSTLITHGNIFVTSFLGLRVSHYVTEGEKGVNNDSFLPVSPVNEYMNAIVS